MTTYLMIVHQDCIYIVPQTNSLKYAKMISFDIVESPILRYKNYDDYFREILLIILYVQDFTKTMTITKSIERLQSNSAIV